MLQHGAGIGDSRSGVPALRLGQNEDSIRLEIFFLQDFPTLLDDFLCMILMGHHVDGAFDP